jgi:hypothetical protein
MVGAIRFAIAPYELTEVADKHRDSVERLAAAVAALGKTRS